VRPDSGGGVLTFLGLDEADRSPGEGAVGVKETPVLINDPAIKSIIKIVKNAEVGGGGVPVPDKKVRIMIEAEETIKTAVSEGVLGMTGEDIILRSNVVGNSVQEIVPETGEFVEVVVGMTTEPEFPRQKVGARIGPTSEPPRMYANDVTNVLLGKKKRIDEKAEKNVFKLQPGGKLSKAIKKVVNQSMYGADMRKAHFHKSKIEAWMENFFEISDLRSGKWSEARAKQAEEKLQSKLFHEYGIKVIVKIEQMGDNKPPRLLLADGDGGQVMALLVIKCFEDLLFAADAQEDRSIKHADKRVALKRLLNRMRVKGKKRKVGKYEGDGAAWDTTCSLEIRNLIENPVLKHIAKMMLPFIVPHEWNEAHEKVNTAKGYKLRFESLFEKLIIKIKAIRRSGHRGTSCLNFWVNFVMWHCVVFGDNAHEFLDSRRFSAVDKFGKKRWLSAGLEGDDSGVTSDPPFTPDELASIAQDWKDAGFDMKLIDRTNEGRMLFIGCAVQLDDNGPTGEFCPDLARFFGKSGYTTSRSAVKSASKDGRELRAIAAASYLSAALEFSHVSRNLTHGFLSYSRRLHVFGEGKSAYGVWEGEMQRRTGQDHAIDVYCRISENVAGLSDDDTSKLNGLGYSCTPYQLERLAEYYAGFNVNGQFGETEIQEFRQLLPPSFLAEV